MTWNDQFIELYRRCLQSYQEGNSDFESYYSSEDLAFLKAIGYKKREFFDFVEDNGDEGVPTESTALLIAAVRRDYFLVEMKGELSGKEITRDDVPVFSEKLANVVYLPRIIKKARAKLRGELDPDLMFSCGGDRKFLADNGNIPAADFLRNVWAAGTDDLKIADYVKNYQG